MGKTFATIMAFACFHAVAATDRDIDKMTTYAVMLGRASGCDIEIKKPLERVGAWMDKVFPPGSQDQQIMLPIFVQGMLDNAKSQRSGNSPDGCNQVRSTINKMKWP